MNACGLAHEITMKLIHDKHVPHHHYNAVLRIVRNKIQQRTAEPDPTSPPDPRQQAPACPC